MIRSLTKTLENYQTDYSLLKDKFEKVQTEFKRQTTKEKHTTHVTYITYTRFCSGWAGIFAVG